MNIADQFNTRAICTNSTIILLCSQHVRDNNKKASLTSRRASDFQKLGRVSCHMTRFTLFSLLTTCIQWCRITRHGHAHRRKMRKKHSTRHKSMHGGFDEKFWWCATRRHVKVHWVGVLAGSWPVLLSKKFKNEMTSVWTWHKKAISPAQYCRQEQLTLKHAAIVYDHQSLVPDVRCAGWAIRCWLMQMIWPEVFLTVT